MRMIAANDEFQPADSQRPVDHALRRMMICLERCPVGGRGGRQVERQNAACPRSRSAGVGSNCRSSF